MIQSFKSGIQWLFLNTAVINRLIQLICHVFIYRCQVSGESHIYLFFIFFIWKNIFQTYLNQKDR